MHYSFASCSVAVVGQTDRSEAAIAPFRTPPTSYSKALGRGADVFDLMLCAATDDKQRYESGQKRGSLLTVKTGFSKGILPYKNTCNACVKMLHIILHELQYIQLQKSD